jgi:mannitol/fructose-specific phosphotransferase system IIA component (Ntr-type)
VLQFEYLSRNEYEGDYEVIQTVFPEDFVLIANKFGLDPSVHILEIIQQISDLGRGEEFVDALNNKEIKCELFTWLS